MWNFRQVPGEGYSYRNPPLGFMTKSLASNVSESFKTEIIVLTFLNHEVAVEII